MGGGDPLDTATDAGLEVSGWFAARNDVPPFLLIDRHRDRILVGDLLPQDPALPLTEEHLAKVGLDDRLDAQALGERRRGLMRARERRHIDRRDALPGGDQPVGHLFGLDLAVLVERRIGMPAHHRERLTFHHRGRLAVADEEDLARARRGREPVLTKLTRGAHVPDRNGASALDRYASSNALWLGGGPAWRVPSGSSAHGAGAPHASSKTTSRTGRRRTGP